MPKFHQDILPHHPRDILYQEYKCRNPNDIRASMSMLGTDTEVIGADVRLNPDGVLDVVALATPNRVHVLRVDIQNTIGTSDDAQQSYLLGAFNVAAVALHIFRDTGCAIRGVDLSTLLAETTDAPRHPSDVVKKTLGVAETRSIDRLWEDTAEDAVVLRAWISAVVSSDQLHRVVAQSKVDTANVEHQHLVTLGTLVREVYLLQAARPTEVEHTFDSLAETLDGNLELLNNRYQKRVRPSALTRVVIDTQNGQISGQATAAKGKRTTLRVDGGNFRGGAMRVRVFGREELTNAERARDEHVLLVLRGVRRADASELARLLWWPDKLTLARITKQKTVMEHPSLRTLNTSQAEVVTVMVTGEVPLIIVHGPPGTGKTRTIRAAVEIWDERSEPCWIVAQSNVAVKNIAESLQKGGVDFRVIVAKEFYEEWHEHIYEEVGEKLIRSDEIPADPVASERLFAAATVCLCTLGMLSNPVLDQCRIFDLIPVKRLVVDEASQISIFDYMSVFAKCRRLKTVALFGDPKQLPPYGKETARMLQSIFDIKHLKQYAYFLNTQYRIPPTLGQFISENVYDGKLRSWSDHPVKGGACVKFVQARNEPEAQDGTSWINRGEVQTIEYLVKNYYSRTEFCVITPYDAQRSAIERALRSANLPWEDRVFTNDSFQGNERDYTLISLARTEKPGFLVLWNRVNVMLTRCKKGMVIVSSSYFVNNVADRTLLGLLASHWFETYGRGNTWVDWREVAQRRVDLPGVAGARPVVQSVMSPNAPTFQPDGLASAAPEDFHLHPRHVGTSVRGRGQLVNQSVAPQRGGIAGSRTNIHAESNRRGMVDLASQTQFPSLNEESRVSRLTGAWRLGYEATRL